MSRLLPPGEHRRFTVEFGTVDDIGMVLAERAENWVHHHGDRDDPASVDAILEHRRCFTPDEPEWASVSRASGAAILDRALAALAEPRQ